MQVSRLTLATLAACGLAFGTAAHAETAFPATLPATPCCPPPPIFRRRTMRPPTSR